MRGYERTERRINAASDETDLLSADAGTAGKTASRNGKNSEKTIGQTLSGAAVFGRELS